eukprot:scaffold37129_cov21-Prasinocladus_malaysianus.AAC.3
MMKETTLLTTVIQPYETLKNDITDDTDDNTDGNKSIFSQKTTKRVAGLGGSQVSDLAEGAVLGREAAGQAVGGEAEVVQVVVQDAPICRQRPLQQISLEIQV